VNFIKNLPSAGSSPVALSNEDKLRFYSLYKQATEGACTTPQPGFLDMVGRYKWDAWRRLGDLERTAAMQQYVESLLAKARDMPPSQDLARFVEAVTPVRRKEREYKGEEKGEKETQNDARKPNDEEHASVVREERQLARRLDALHESVAAESVRAARLEGLLAGAQPEPQAGELLETLRQVEAGLRAGEREREALAARLGELERLGGRVQDELRRTHAALSSTAWLVAGAAVALPAVLLVVSWLNRRR
jgi:acyl-CoA-binding protein